MSVLECPRRCAERVDHLLPYFIDWKISNRVVWPGGVGRLEHSVRLAGAFDFLEPLISKYSKEQTELDAKQREGKA